LRKRKQAASIPAHSGLITKIKFDETGEYLASSSFDGSIKLWSCRNWKVLKELQGHEGKVTGIDLNKNVVVSSGFDKTLKLWR
jgi:U4/U6 small nuclear ribonucleoprotein PRP4